MKSLKTTDLAMLREQERKKEKEAKRKDLLLKKQAGENVEEDLRSSLQTKEELHSFYTELATVPARQAAILDAIETQLDLLTELTLILAEQMDPQLTKAQHAAVKAMKEKLMPVRALSLSEGEDAARFQKLIKRKAETRNMQAEYHRLKEETD